LCLRGTETASITMLKHTLITIKKVKNQHSIILSGVILSGIALAGLALITNGKHKKLAKGSSKAVEHSPTDPEIRVLNQATTHHQEPVL
jgi:hypothetical protein